MDPFACTGAIQAALQEVEYAFSPSEIPILQLYEGFCGTDKEIHRLATGYGVVAMCPPVTTLTNNMFKTLSVWALAKLRRCQNPHAQREMNRFLCSLQESAYHLRLALLTDSVMRDELLFPPQAKQTVSAPAPAPTSSSS